MIGDPTLADAILDRVIHNTYRIELTGDSLRKRRAAEIAGWADPSGRARRQAGLVSRGMRPANSVT